MTKKKHSLLLGAHMSISGGLEKSIERGESINCTAIQIFTKSNRQWTAKKLTDDSRSLFKERVKDSFIRSIIVHATYLINLGSPDIQTNKKSVTAVCEELKRCEQLDIPYLVLHPGSHLKSGEKTCLEKISDALNTIFEKTPGKTMILLENMAGQGSQVCYSFEQLAYIRSRSAYKKRLGICFDTCHAFAAGYDFRTQGSYTKIWKQFDTIIGLENLKAIHINDSKKELGSKIDRHEEIGKGKIGLEAFRLLFNDKRFFDIPKILETPKDHPDPRLHRHQNQIPLHDLRIPQEDHNLQDL